MSEFLDNVGQKAKDFAEQTKLSGELHKLRDQRNGMYAQLGQMYYDYQKKEGAAEPDYSQLLAAIDSVNANTKAIEERIASLKSGRDRSAQDHVAQMTGTFVPPEGSVNAQFYGTPGGPVCKNCGSPVAPGIKFCVKCGSPQ